MAVNLGTPTTPTARGRRYLANSHDPRVVAIPPLSETLRSGDLPLRSGRRRQIRPGLLPTVPVMVSPLLPGQQGLMPISVRHAIRYGAPGAAARAGRLPPKA